MTHTTTDAAEARALTEHQCWRKGLGRLSHRHWFHRDQLQPTCELCGTPIDREHKETGPVSWEPEKRPEVITLDHRYAISNAAMKALGDWLAWPDAGRDGSREVTVQQTLSFLSGLPNKLAFLASAEAASGAGERGTGWVFWNPDSGEEYASSHPIESGECCEAERIRPSTPQEDTLWQAFQDQFVRAEAATAALASLPPATDPAMVDTFRQALEDVCNPLGYIQRKAEAEGNRLSGMAYAIANDIATVQQIARAALAAAPTIPATGERECPSSPDGRHQVDTSMESGPNNCFHCEAPMGGK